MVKTTFYSRNSKPRFELLEILVVTRLHRIVAQILSYSGIFNAFTLIAAGAFESYDEATHQLNKYIQKGEIVPKWH